MDNPVPDCDQERIAKTLVQFFILERERQIVGLAVILTRHVQVINELNRMREGQNLPVISKDHFNLEVK